ncbi:MAG: DUF2442 domain-containing protein [Janthinobacterium lividum]
MADPTDAEIDVALERGRAAQLTEPRARTCRYDCATGRIVVELTNGCVFAFPACLGEGLDQASDEDLAQVEILGGGSGLHWEVLDADLSVPGLLSGLFGTRIHMARQAGRTPSPAKAAAARSNGLKGGRPRKQA